MVSWFSGWRSDWCANFRADGITAATGHHTSSCRSCRVSCRMSGQLDVLPTLQTSSLLYTLSQKKRNILEVVFPLEQSVYQWIWGYTSFQQCSYDPGSHDTDPGPKEKSMKKSCVSFETECNIAALVLACGVAHAWKTLRKHFTLIKIF